MVTRTRRWFRAPRTCARLPATHTFADLRRKRTVKRLRAWHGLPTVGSDSRIAENAIDAAPRTGPYVARTRARAAFTRGMLAALRADAPVHGR
jgi:hypothetical protein